MPRTGAQTPRPPVAGSAFREKPALAPGKPSPAPERAEKEPRASRAPNPQQTSRPHSPTTHSPLLQLGHRPPSAASRLCLRPESSCSCWAEPDPVSDSFLHTCTAPTRHAHTGAHTYTLMCTLGHTYTHTHRHSKTHVHACSHCYTCTHAQAHTHTHTFSSRAPQGK